MTKLVKLGFGHLKMENKPCIASVLSKRFHSKVSVTYQSGAGVY